MNGITRAGKTLGLILTKNSPGILTGLGVAGVVTTAVMAARVTPQALIKLNDLDCQYRTSPELDGYPTIAEKVKSVWPLYLPAAGVGTLTITCILLANRIQANRLAVALGAYSIAETALQEYQEAVLSETGNKTFEAVKDQVAQQRIEKNPLTEPAATYRGGETLCYEPISGRYFYSDIEHLRKSQNTLNHRLINDVWIDLNELYSEIGLEQTKMGDKLGWTPDHLIEFNFRTMLANDSTPCLVLDFAQDPTLNIYR